MYFNQIELGVRVRECRKNHSMTQEQLGLLIGVDKNHISRIERGAIGCSIDLLVILSDALQVSADYLLTGKTIDKDQTRAQILSVISQLTNIAKNIC